MFYKSSILAAVFVLLSIGNAIAADFSNTENIIAEQPSELIVNAHNLKAVTTENSARIAKARLLKIPATNINQIKNTGYTIPNPTNFFEIAQHQSTVPEVSAASNTINQPEINNISTGYSQSTASYKITDASSELNTIKQWEINKSVTLNDILPAPAIAQAPTRLPDSSVPSVIIETVQPVAPTIPTPKPVIAPLVPTTPVVEAQKPTITSGANESIAKPTAPIIDSQKPESPIPAPQIIEAQKPEPPNNEPKKWAVGVHTQLSTTGFVGVDAGYKFSPNLHARLGINTVGFNVDYTSQGIDYKASVSPTNVHLLGDFFPFGGGLRLTGGLVLQNNQLNATGTPNSSAIPGGIPTQINLGGVNYNINDVGTVSSEGSFSNSVAPYLGIGFGTPISPGLGFNFDAGVIFAGAPNIRLRANIPSTVPASIQNDIRNSLAEQERRTNNDIGSFSVYPVVSIGLSYAF
jgi:hypothetical protein